MRSAVSQGSSRTPLRSCTSAFPLPSRRVSSWVVRAVEEKKEQQVPKDEEKKDRILEQLKKTGMDTSKAKQVLKAWADVGVKEPEQLRKLLISRTTAPIPGLGLQALFDSVASYGGFYTADLTTKAQDFPFKIGIEVLANFFGIYYFIQVLLEVSVIGGLLYTSYKYGTNSAQLLAAVQALAGPTTGLTVLDKGLRVVNVLKVVQALETVAAMLKDEFKDPPKNDSLRNLGAYLTLSHARDNANFTPEKFGLTDKEAGNIAYAFSTFDTNSNFKLEPAELGALCESLGSKLDTDEVAEAMKLLDQNNNGIIEFTEFVRWWVKRAKSPSPSPPPMRGES